MNPYRSSVARAADALVLASRQAMGLPQTVRGFLVLSPVESLSRWRMSVLMEVVDCAIRRMSRMDGRTITRLRKNMKPM